MAPSVDDLRQQLRERGYLSHGIERWFALDPLSSRTFWVELLAVALKGSVLIALFGALPLVAVMLFRNHPLSAWETFLMTAIYGGAGVLVAFALLVAIALGLKLRPEMAIDTPRVLLAISFAAAGLLALLTAFWWYRFDTRGSITELVTGLALVVIFFLMSTVVVSAALLSFSIYELRRVPAIHQKPRGIPMSIAAVVLIALLFIPTYAAQDRPLLPPEQVVTAASQTRVVLIAVDGLTSEIFESKPELRALLPHVIRAESIAAESATERWATVGTGVPTRFHGVRAIEGVRLAGGKHVIQSLSRADVVMHRLAEAVGLARRQPLPPTVRRRAYVWEIFAGRGVPSLAVNWWTTENINAGGLRSVGQESIFSAAAGGAKQRPAETTALDVDAIAARDLLANIDSTHPTFATAYLPALDVLLNRLGLDQSTRLTTSVQALGGIAEAVKAVRERNYDVLLIGLPGDRQKGSAVIASTAAIANRASAMDVAPTLCTLLGFPASSEMPGTPIVADRPQPRITTYGARTSGPQSGKVNDEYYRNLRSLGYIR